MNPKNKVKAPISISGQCLYHHSHLVLQRLHPELRYDGNEIAVITKHIADFSLHGLRHLRDKR